MIFLEEKMASDGDRCRATKMFMNVNSNKVMSAYLIIFDERGKAIMVVMYTTCEIITKNEQM